MSAILLMVTGLAAFTLGYLFYSRFISERVFQLSADFQTPAHAKEDGVDFVPTNKWVLWGHHFTSVAGAAPIVGPAIAVIWGWLPAFLWVTLGTVFFAGIHDAGALWASVRNEGKSIGSLTEKIRTALLQIGFQCRRGDLAQGHDSLLASFAEHANQ